MDSEKEVLLSESEPSSPAQSAPHPLISHVTPAFVARPDLLPMQTSTPIIEAVTIPSISGVCTLLYKCTVIKTGFVRTGP